MKRDEKLGLYKAAVEQAGLKLKGKNNHYTSVNGHMQSFLGKDGVFGLRLSKEEREAFMKKFSVGQPVQYNTVMKDYVELSDDFVQNTELFSDYLRQSHDYVSSLKPKPTRQ